MNSIRYNVVFDKPDKKYIAGEIVRCKVYIEVLTKFKARSLSIRFLGVAHTEWTKTESDRKSGTKRVRYTGDEEYFRTYMIFVGHRNGDLLP